MRNRPSAFTLIETLMVIAIVVLLVGIAFAAMGPTREKARQATCVSNLNQIGRAIALYQADYDGADAVKGVPMSCTQLGLPCNGRALTVFENEYIRTRAILFCPSYHRDFPIEQMSSTYWLIGSDDTIHGGNGYSNLVAERGSETPLRACDQHNDRLNFERQARWLSKRVHVLRLSQQVQVKRVPARDMSAARW